MNYRHGFHAGNFADVLKHVSLLLCLARLKTKEKPFFILDTHAGRGVYDLTGEDALRSPEWRDGVERLIHADIKGRSADDGLVPYRTALAGYTSPDGLRTYPGSPKLIAGALRPQDRMVFNELHPIDREALKATFADDARVRTTSDDAYIALKANLPPTERRGLVLIDPPFEAPDEFDRLSRGLAQAKKRWASGGYLIWRPLKHLDRAEAFDDALRADWPADAFLRADLWVRALGQPGKLAGAGLIFLNPPYGVRESLEAVLPALAETLAQGDGAGWRLD